MNPFDVCKGSGLYAICSKARATPRNVTLQPDPLQDQRFPKNCQTTAGTQSCGGKPTISSLEPGIGNFGGNWPCLVRRAISPRRSPQIAPERKHGAFHEGPSEARVGFQRLAAGEPSAQLNSSTRAFPVRAIGHTQERTPTRWSCASGEQFGGLIWLRAAQLGLMLNPQYRESPAPRVPAVPHRYHAGW